MARKFDMTPRSRTGIEHAAMLSIADWDDGLRKGTSPKLPIIRGPIDPTPKRILLIAPPPASGKD